MDLQLITQLINTVTSSGLKSFEVEENGFRLKLENNVQLTNAAPVQIQAPTQAVAMPAVAQNVIVENNIDTAPVATEVVESEENFHYITSPIVGIYSPLSALGKDNLKNGDKITAGSIVCAFEAMKLINEIKSDVDGEFVEAMVNEGDEVEYGQLLIKIRKA